MSERFPGYDVLSKRGTPSWNEVTRRVVDERLHAVPRRTFFSEREWTLVETIADTLLPQDDRDAHDRIAIAPSIDDALSKNEGNGYRREGVPPLQQFWREGLAAVDETSVTRFGRAFADLSRDERTIVLA
ncbi:MAG TPA: gluconate 2-dehydrogenase subunit 3 family protein, partial [Thermoanaerobaculia bacterium]|nr:gluconate 2-dehydrogenase subunit 3 family protein [Thermoanaerobaculia bacterium]